MSDTPDLSDLDQLAAETFQTPDEASEWMSRPHPMLEGQAPLQAAQTDQGFQRVKEILVAIRYGGVA